MSCDLFLDMVLCVDTKSTYDLAEITKTTERLIDKIQQTQFGYQLNNKCIKRCR